MRQTGRQSTVHAENLAGHDGGNWKTVEGIDETLPDLDVAASLTLVIETIYPCDVSTLMITTEQEEILRIFELIAQQQENSKLSFSLSLRCVGPPAPMGHINDVPFTDMTTVELSGVANICPRNPSASGSQPKG